MEERNSATRIILTLIDRLFQEDPSTFEVVSLNLSQATVVKMVRGQILD
jgi:hypothetical protein